MRIVLENEEGFYRDLVTVNTKEEVVEFVKGYKQGKKERTDLDGKEPTENVVAFLTGYARGQDSVAWTISYRNGFELGFQNLKGNVQVKE